MTNMRKLLILDIDHTLLFATENFKLLSYPNLKPDVSIDNLNLYLRPHLNEFLDEVNNKYDLALWTMGNLRYCLKIKELIFEQLNINLKFTYSQYDSEFDSEGSYKNINKVLNYNKSSIICLDDSRHVHRKNPENLRFIRPFYGNPFDCELKRILKFL